MARIETVTPAELEARRAAIVDALGMSLDALRRLAETHTLTPQEWDALTELREIEFLLGD